MTRIWAQLPLNIKQLSTYLGVYYLIAVVFVYSIPTWASGDLCLDIYDRGHFTKLMVKENLGDLARIDGEWFEVAIPEVTGTGVVFHFKEVKTWSEVLTSFDGISLNARQVAKIKLLKYAKKFSEISGFFKSVAHKKNAIMKARLKDLGSLKDKIIDHAKKESIDGKDFPFANVDDFLGVRLMLPTHSDLLDPLRFNEEMTQQELKDFYSGKLGLEIESILKVDIKGGQEDQAKGKYYRSIHLTLAVSEGLPMELQMMSKSMAIWHAWDHPKVYKTKYIHAGYVKQLKQYSQFWVRMIRTIEDSSFAHRDFKEIDQLLSEYGLNSRDFPFPSRNISHWMAAVDGAIAQQLKIWGNDQFLSVESILPTSKKRQLSRELVPLELF